MSVIKKFCKIFGIVCMVLTIVLCVLAGGLYLKYRPLYLKYKEDAVRAVEESTADTFTKNLTGYIYDDNNNLISRLSIDMNADYLRYKDIPKDTINAFISIEDRHFREHKGYDLGGILRVGWRYLVTGGEEKHGASTITQQLARSVFLSNDVTLERKAREILTAVEIEKKYSKNEILEFYINNAYFANRCYGIEAAAKRYFGKSSAELTLSETAYLCAIPNSPSYYDPLEHADHALARRDKILEDMHDCGYITNTELREAKYSEIALKPQAAEKIQNYETTYAADCAIRYLMELNGFLFRYDFEHMDDYQDYLDAYNDCYEACRKKLYTGGYVVRTSLNEEKQALLQNTIDEALAFDEEVGSDGVYALQSASAVIDNQSHKVVAIVGGRSQDTEVYTLNRAYQSYRQPGSSFKPLAVYAPALDQGYTADSLLPNINISLAKGVGLAAVSLPGSRIRLDQAVERSVNGCAWWLFCSLSPEKALSYVKHMEFSRIVPDDHYPASALGGLTYGTTTVEMANGYSTLANLGVFHPATCLTSLKDRDGRELYAEAEAEEIYTPGAASRMVNILKGVIRRGTASAMGWNLTVEAAGKTGTTNGCKDGWFCGITPDYSMSVWVGYDEPRILKNLYGATYPAAIWKTVMSELVKDSGHQKFDVPAAEAEELYMPADAQAQSKYLPGRDDDEVLSDGYTVRNYREDHSVADQADAVMYQMQTLNRDAENDMQEWNRLYEEAKTLIEQIYSQKLRAQEAEKLENLKDGILP